MGAAGLGPPLLLSLGVLAASGCHNPSDSSGWSGRIDTLENGAIRVSNPSVGRWTPDEAWTIEEDLRIGDVEGTGPATFRAVSFIEVDAQGRIWVFDSNAQEFRVFDRGGRFVRTVGRRGEGPGEFKMVSGMSWAPSGALWVLDPGNLRFTVYDTAGLYRGAYRVEGGSLIMPWPGGFDRQGWLRHYARRPRSSGDGFELVIVRYDSTLTPLDALAIPQLEKPESFEWRTGRRYMRAAIPFTAQPVWHLSLDGTIWFTEANDYAIVHTGPSGDTLRIVRKEFERARVTERDLDSAVATLDWFTKSGGRFDRSRIPGQMPALRDFYFDDEGRLWVLPYGGERRPTPVLDVFDDAGRYLGGVVVPFSFRAEPAPIIRGGAFHAVTRDELDVPYVVRGRIIRGTRDAPGAGESGILRQDFGGRRQEGLASEHAGRMGAVSTPVG